MENNDLKKVEMFNRKASKRKYKSNEVIDTLKIKKGFKIADIGSGGGYFTFKFAEKVGLEGRVYAIDTNSEFLKYIESQSIKNKLKNITTIQTEDDKPRLPNQKLDYIFLRNVYHHLPNRIKYLQELGIGLKDTGRIIIIEHNGSGFFNFNKIFGHFVKPEIIIKEMKKAGYIVDNKYYFIRQQSFTMFKKKKKNE